MEKTKYFKVDFTKGTILPLENLPRGMSKERRKELSDYWVNHPDKQHFVYCCYVDGKYVSIITSFSEQTVKSLLRCYDVSLTRIIIETIQEYLPSFMTSIAYVTVAPDVHGKIRYVVLPITPVQ